ncbi:MAG TPA: anti-sigma factor [Methylomirabilota bacterium]|jgi:hypothetical protein
MTHEPFEELIAVYAVGALDGEDLVRLRAHLAAGCAHCGAALRDAQDGLARAAAPVPPPPHVKQALLARMAAGVEPARRRRAWLPWALATAAAVIAGAAFTGAFVAVRYEARLGQMAREVSAAREQLRREAAALELLRDPATRVVALLGAGPQPAAVGRVIWHDRAGGELFVVNLTPAPRGKAYELWTIAGGQPRPAALFEVDATGKASARIEPTGGGVDVFAVTLEPERGVPAPTGPIVLASKEPQPR